MIHIRTTVGSYTFPAKSKTEAIEILLTLHRMGIECIWWTYEEMEVK